MYSSTYLDHSGRVQSHILHPLHQAMEQGKSLPTQNRNTCPLCRQVFLAYTYKKRRIALESPRVTPTPPLALAPL